MNSERSAVIEHAYREFACFAARRAWQTAGCVPCEQVVLAVESYLRGETDFTEVQRVRDAQRGGVAGAGVIGLPRAMPAAAAQIAAWHTADDSAETAARQVIQHAAAAAGYKALGEVADVMGLDVNSGWRNHEAWLEKPEIEATARAAEKAFLEAQLQDWLDRVGVLGVEGLRCPNED